MLGVLFTVWSVLTTSLDDIIGWFKILAFFVGLFVAYKFAKSGTNKRVAAAALGEGVVLPIQTTIQPQPQPAPQVKQQIKARTNDTQKMKLGAAQLWNCAQCRGMLDADFGLITEGPEGPSATVSTSQNRVTCNPTDLYSLNRNRTRALCQYCIRKQ